jgi:hypothetical protein
MPTLVYSTFIDCLNGSLLFCVMVESLRVAYIGGGISTCG